MEHIIDVTIRNKVAMCAGARYICGNSDYGVRFDFDEEWDKFDVKTARFRWKSQYVDVVFSGTDCPVPVIIDVDLFSVGVYAGNLRTTTPAYIGADRSILCGAFTPEDPSPDVYSQIMAQLNALYDEVKAFTGDYAPDDFIVRPDVAGIDEVLVVAAVDEDGKPTEWSTMPLDVTGPKGDGSVFIVEVTPDENWNPVPSHTREEVFAAINERKFIVLRIGGFELSLDPYPEVGDVLPDDAELRFSAETGGSTLYLYWTADGIFPSEDNWVSRYTGLLKGYHIKNGTRHIISDVSEDVFGLCHFAFEAQGDYRTGDTFTIQFYAGEGAEPYDVEVTPMMWNMETLPDKFFTKGALVYCVYDLYQGAKLYFMGGMDGKPGKDGLDGYTPVKGTDYFTEADKAEMVSAVISALPVYDGEFMEVVPT